MNWSVGSKILLTSISNLVARGLEVGTFFIVTPFLFAALGPSFFGAYQFANKLSVFGGMTNFGATTYLKVHLSALGSRGAEDEYRRLVGTSITQFVVLTPLLVPFLFGTYWLVTGGQPLTGQYWGVLALLIATPIAQLLSVPQVALFAAGQGYKGTSVAAVITSAAAFLGAFLALNGEGILGVAAARFLGMLIVCGVSLWIARTNLFWFGVIWPDASRLKAAFPSAFGLAAASMGYLAIQQFEVLSFGAVEGAESVGAVVIAGVLVLVLELVLGQFIRATIPTIGPLLRAANWETVRRMRRQIHSMVMLGWMVAVPPILLLSDVVVKVWVGEGVLVTPLLLAVLLGCSFLRATAYFDANILDQMGRHRGRIVMAAAAFAVVLIPGILFIGHLDYWYVCIPVGMALYRFVLYRQVVARLRDEDGPGSEMVWVLAVLAASAICAVLFADHLERSWLARGAAIGILEVGVGLLVIRLKSLSDAARTVFVRGRRFFADVRSAIRTHLDRTATGQQ